MNYCNRCNTALHPFVVICPVCSDTREIQPSAEWRLRTAIVEALTLLLPAHTVAETKNKNVDFAIESLRAAFADLQQMED